jgi:hypothetical protein
MTTSHIAEPSDRSFTDPDQALVHQYIRVFGHRPTPEELARYRRAQLGMAVQLPARLRRGAARIITGS